MSWQLIDKKFKKVYNKKTISSNDKQAIQILKKVIQHDFPYLKAKGLEEAIEKAFQKLEKPYLRIELVELIIKMMNEVSYKSLFKKV